MEEVGLICVSDVEGGQAVGGGGVVHHCVCVWWV
jgi:hypothetical protein